MSENKTTVPLPYLPVTMVPLPSDLGVDHAAFDDDMGASETASQGNPPLPGRRSGGGRLPSSGDSSPKPSLMLSMLSGVSPDDHGAEELLDRHTSRNAARLTLDGRRAAVIILVLAFVLSVSLTMLAQQTRHVDIMAVDGTGAASTESSVSPADPSGSASPRSPASSAASQSAASQSASSSPAASPSPSSDPSASATVGGTSAAIDLNTATAEQLETINGIGPVTARKILDHRTRNGRFSNVDELLDVPGIGAKTLEKIRPHVTVGA
ncbi:ComEA family DNA-binding protein [Bifidobacterium catulorum]|nr:helix-hairpin-helix domain-containing protein [Bifidobacterium catulorum]